MRRHVLLVLVLGLVGCDGEFSDADPNPPEDGCPEGMDRITDAGLTPTLFSVNGLDVFTAFDPTATYGTLPAACMGTDGRSLQLVFTAAGEPYGVILVESLVADTFTAQDPAITFSVTLFTQDDPDDPANPVFSGNDWQTGVVSVRSVGSVFDVDATGTGFSSGQNLTLQFSARGRL